ncbi:HAD-IIIA family hydrolase [Candidatus Woesearchaeota archaeon]|nr:HAD-IIIA family hydrolase [Candidatus Woesearchaeota archaeon]
MTKTIFLDRDGTLVVDPGYVYKIKDFKLHEGVIEGLKKLKDFTFFVITNQSGIGRGHFTEKDMHIFNNHLLDELKNHDIKIKEIYFCPHSPYDGCDCRKPGDKLAREAYKKHDIDLKNSWVIGDTKLDCGLAKKIGAKSIHVLTGYGVKHLDEVKELNPSYIAANIDQAADFITFKNEKKIIPREKIVALAERLKKEGKKMVTINGAFDILHKGHAKILKEAKKQGDILIVGLNSDSSIRANKGPKRPVNNQESRAKMLAAFSFVDYVVIFDEKTPLKLLEEIKPNIHVNGSEYGEDCIEAPIVKKYGGKIYVVSLLEGCSTTGILRG